MTNDSYDYDEANRLIEVNGLAYPADAWDDNGNLRNDGVNQYEYDSANRLISLSGQGTNAAYAYNGLGDRIQEIVNGNTTTFTMDLNMGLTQVLSDGTNNYIYSNDRIAQTQGEATEYFLGDALGSVRQITSASSAITYVRAYDPYGVVTATDGSSQSAYGYTGEFMSNDMVYLRARFYAPETGRFLTRDTWAGDANRPLSFNAWNYGYGNPVKYTDPTGHTVQDPLTATQWSLAKQEAIRFGIPKELVAGTLAAEIVYDSDFINTMYDVSTAAVGGIADIAFILRDRTGFNICYQTLEGFHEYFGLAPWLENKGIGYGSAPGIANMHAGPAVRTEEYINSTYLDQGLMPDLGLDNHPGVRLRTLLTDEGGIRYAAGYLRWYADLRKGTETDHT